MSRAFSCSMWRRACRRRDLERSGGERAVRGSGHRYGRRARTELPARCSAGRCCRRSIWSTASAWSMATSSMARWGSISCSRRGRYGFRQLPDAAARPLSLRLGRTSGRRGHGRTGPQCGSRDRPRPRGWRRVDERELSRGHDCTESVDDRRERARGALRARLGPRRPERQQGLDRGGAALRRCRSRRRCPADVRARLVRLAGRRLTDEGMLVIRAERFRTQERNREDARERLVRAHPRSAASCPSGASRRGRRAPPRSAGTRPRRSAAASSICVRASRISTRPRARGINAGRGA